MALVIAAVVVHAGVLAGAVMRRGSIDGYAFDSLDCGEYYRIAQNVVRHGAFSQSLEPPLTPDTWRTPGHPSFLAIFMLMFGDSPAMLVIGQQVLSVFNVLLLFWTARHWMGSGRAMATAGLFLVDPYHLFYSLWLLSTTLFVTAILLTWLAWSLARRTRRWPWFAMLGAISGLLVLVHPIGGLVPIAILVGIVAMSVQPCSWCAERDGVGPQQSAIRNPQSAIDGPLPYGRGSEHRRGSERRWRIALGGLASFVLPCAVVVGSWMARNYVVAGHFALSDQGGVVLAYFKATEVILWNEGRQAARYAETTLDPAKVDWPHRIWEQTDERLRARFPSLPEDQRRTLRWQNIAQGNRSAVDSFKVSRALTKIGWEYLAASPFKTAACYLARCGAILTFPLDLALKPPDAVPHTRWAWTLKGSIYLGLCLAALVRLCRRGLALDRVYFPLSCTIALLAATTPQIDPRFRVPMIPLLLFVALLPVPRRPAASSVVGDA